MNLSSLCLHNDFQLSIWKKNVYQHNRLPESFRAWYLWQDKAEEGGNAVDPRFLLGHGVLIAELCQQLYRLLSGAFCPDYAPAHRSGIVYNPAVPVPRRSRMRDAIVYCLEFPIKYASFPVCVLSISYQLPVRNRIRHEEKAFCVQKRLLFTSSLQKSYRNLMGREQ